MRLHERRPVSGSWHGCGAPVGMARGLDAGVTAARLPDRRGAALRRSSADKASDVWRAIRARDTGDTARPQEPLAAPNAPLSARHGVAEDDERAARGVQHSGAGLRARESTAASAHEDQREKPAVLRSAACAKPLPCRPSPRARHRAVARRGRGARRRSACGAPGVALGKRGTASVEPRAGPAHRRAEEAGLLRPGAQAASALACARRNGAGRAGARRGGPAGA